MFGKRKARLMNRLRFIFDRKLTVGNLLDKAAASHGEEPLFFLDKPLPYGDLGQAVNLNKMRDFCDKYRHILDQLCGLKRYDRVAILQANSPSIFLSGYAAMRAGFIAVPVNGGMPSESAGRYLSYTGAKALITDAATYERLRKEGGIADTLSHILISDGRAPLVQGDSRYEVISLQDTFETVEAFGLPAIEMAGDDVCLICHTSGTTGFPKGVIHTNSSLVNGIKGQLKVEPITSADRGMSAAPFNHFINFSGLMSAMAANVGTWLVTAEEAKPLLDLIDREKISVVFCFPHTYLKFYEYGLERHSLESVRLWIAGADSSHEAHIKPLLRKGALLRVFGRKIVPAMFVDSLGSSEVGFAALFRFTLPSSKLFGRYVGKPTFAGPKVKIADEEGRRVPNGTPGRLMVKGPTLFAGYWNNHERLLGERRDGWWWTGDVAYRDGKGRFFHLDRAVDVISTCRGDVYSQPVEEILLLNEGLHEAVVVGVGAAKQQRVVALVQMAPSMEGKPLEQLAKIFNAQLAPEQQLDIVLKVSEAEIPRGLTGKVLKRVLRDQVENGCFDLNKPGVHAVNQ